MDRAEYKRLVAEYGAENVLRACMQGIETACRDLALEFDKRSAKGSRNAAIHAKSLRQRAARIVVMRQDIPFDLSAE